VTAVEEHRCLAVRRGELEPARRRLIGRLYLGDDAGDRSVAKRIFCHSQHLGILAALRVEDAIGAKPDLFKARGVKVELRERPQDGEAGPRGEAGSDACREQGRGRVVAQRRPSRRDLMQPGAVQPMIGQPVIKRRQPERQRWPALALSLRELCAKRS